nr:immunoglobulin heavy chain junction region [Macaca mulatta]MOX93505.1 immunoglobulin heavy chain junction region [Macaca mulatta]MOX95886.1 immunoglobulin heavy chain junction region [Macaca mulatta]
CTPLTVVDPYNRFDVW